MNNKLRTLLNEGKGSVATRIASAWPIITEIVGVTGNYDYVEYLTEYAPHTVLDYENLARACEVHNMGSIVKVDYQNRAYVAQKAIAAGMQGILFTDCKTAEDVANCIYVTMPDSIVYGGRMGYPNYRFIGYEPAAPQMTYAQHVKDIVRLFMIEKKDAVDNIEEICKVPGVDMIQFGPSDYSMSLGKNLADTRAEAKEAERHCIKVALENGVQPRAEVWSIDDLQYYLDLGVKHICFGDQLKILREFWGPQGKIVKEKVHG